ncbi:MAG TPA: P-type conjugative transfer protein TrbL [Candidatus Accumulibacter phosphatis]|nr:P-type conjugative transfer protein TrbL [Candidatus Accumulibacter phosphatis]
MSLPAVRQSTIVPLLLWLALFSIDAQAAINNAGILDNVLTRYAAAASTWAGVITARASFLFWTLAVISMVWTFGMLALRKADLGDFYAEFFRFTVFTGFFWWLLTNGPRFATDIMDSLRTLGGMATGTGATLTPSGIVDIGFDIFFKVLDQSSLWSPVDSAAGILISAAILIILALIGVNMLVLLVSGWILSYAGVFFLGFGGSRWTSDMAIGYYKTVLNIAAQLFTMVLLVGIGKSFVDQYYAGMSAGISLKELGVMMIVAVVMFALVTKLPALIGGLAMGGSVHTMGSGLGTGAAMAAVGMASAAVGVAGAAIAAGAASMAGGTQALMAAFSKASQDVAGGSDMLSNLAGGSSSGAGRSSGGGGASPLAAAMDSSSSAGGGSSGGGSSHSGRSDTRQASAKRGGTSGEVQSGGRASVVAKVGKVAAGTVANLAQGTWDVAKAKAGEMGDAAMDRIGETTGGKIASAIKARSDQKPVFGSDSLAKADDQSVDAESEIAAFRDRAARSS